VIDYTQVGRLISVDTPLGKDVLLMQGFSAEESISQLFNFHLEVLAENETEVAFDRLLGQRITVLLMAPDHQQRYFSGMCNRISQGVQDRTFTSYRMEVVPQFWLLTRRARSRIFQQMTVPDILKKVLEGLDVKYDIQGTFHPRDYCVQYRETDFNFASRLMEEEGIYYFFTHAAGGHKMVVGNTPQTHPDMPIASTIVFDAEDGGNREEDRIHQWEKVQELRSGKYTLWDHCFELPGKHLEAEQQIQDSVVAGKVTHKLKVGGNDKLELYDYPGAYAQRFDGVDRGGGNRPGDLQKIFSDNARTVGIRMQQEAVGSLTIHGSSRCRQLVSGHKFILENHFNGDGAYLVTGVSHAARLNGDFRSGDGMAVDYQNTFTCIPLAVPYRPARVAPKPVVQGTQTAVVVGPDGQEIFTDKYGRVKVQFHWDREGKNNAESSCWVRVAQTVAGKRWGALFIPRIGMEVVTDFIEGDPDQPIIIGSVYNAENMPPNNLPGAGMINGVKSNSTPGGGGNNCIMMDDTKGNELYSMNAQYNCKENVGNNRTTNIGVDDSLTVGSNQTIGIGTNRKETVGGTENITITGHRTEEVNGGETVTVNAGRTETVNGGETVTVNGARSHTVNGVETTTISIAEVHSVGAGRMHNVGAAEAITVGGAQMVNVGGAQMVSIGGLQKVNVGALQSITVGGPHKLSAAVINETSKGVIKIKAAGTTIVEAPTIILKAGGSKIIMNSSGVTIKGSKVTVKADGSASIKAGGAIKIKGSNLGED
jgi:type VI secretion system secreted protein VgrG